MRSVWLALVVCACSSKKHEAPPAPPPVVAVVVADAAPIVVDAPSGPDPHARITTGSIYLDTTGNQAFDGTFDRAMPFHGGRACVTLEKGDQLIDEHGKVVAKRPGFWCVNLDFTEGVAIFDDKIVDPNMKTVATIRFKGAKPDESYQFSDGLAPVRVGPKWGFVDHTGTFVIPPTFGPDDVYKPGSDVELDPGGNPMVPDDYYDYIKDFDDGLAAVRKGDKWGYIDKTGAFAIAPQLDELPFHPQFHDGLAKFYAGKKIGFMDHAGKPAIPAIYDDATVFSEGVAGVRAGDHWEYVDRAGKTAIKLAPTVDYAESFSEGLAMIRRGPPGKNGTTYTFVDHKGTTFGFEYARGASFEHGVAYINDTLIDKTGRTLWPK
jgi:WG containing repeat